jgi:hypothetical protein
MNEYNYQIVWYSKEYFQERVIRRGLNEREANEMLQGFIADSRIMGISHKEGYIIVEEDNYEKEQKN